MEGANFDEARFFRTITRSPARALLIGRRALVALGLPVITADYDFWVHPDGIEVFNGAVLSFDLRPNRDPSGARATERYTLENDEHVDVLVARVISTIDAVPIEFDAVWSRR